MAPLAEATLPQTGCLLPHCRVFASSLLWGTRVLGGTIKDRRLEFADRSINHSLSLREQERKRECKRERETERAFFASRLSRGSNFKPKPQSRKLAEAIFLKRPSRKQKQWRTEACGSVSRKGALSNNNLTRVFFTAHMYIYICLL